MKPHSIATALPRSLLPLLATPLLLSQLHAQTPAPAARPAPTPAPAPAPAAATPAAEEEEILMLNVFTVNAEEDTGYVATNSLIGGRVKTELALNPNDVTILTRDLLNDIGANNYRDAVGFLTGAAPIRVDQGIDFGDSVSFRGFPNSYQARNYFRTLTPPDGYIVERIEANRGPNALLFGEAGAGGLINVNTKQARTDKHLAVVSASVDSEGSLRGTIDVNRRLFEGKGGLRVNLLADNRKNFIDDWFQDRYAGHISLVYRPWRGGQLSFEGEMDRASRLASVSNMSDVAALYEAYGNGAYVAAGGPALRTTPTGVIGAFRYDVASRPTIVSGNGAIYDLAGFSSSGGLNSVDNNLNASLGLPSGTRIASTTVNTAPDYRDGIVPSVFLDADRSRNFQPKNALAITDYYLLNVTFQQTLGDLSMEAAVQYGNSERLNQISWFSNHFVDVNATLPDGSPNPRVGQRYSEAFYRPQNNANATLDGRVAVSYKLPLPWEQRINAFVFSREEIFDQENYRIARTNNTAATRFDNVQNEPTFRRYWNDPAPQYGLPVSDARYSWRMWQQGDFRQEQNTESAQISTSINLFEKRLSLMGGYRYDDYTNATRGVGSRFTGGVANNFIDTNEIKTLVDNPAVNATVKTKTFGAVYYPIFPVGVYANYAESFNPAVSGSGLYTPAYGPSINEGKGAGIRLRLLDNKLSGSIGYYEIIESSRQVNVPNGDINGIWNAFGETSRTITPQNYSDIQDFEGDGIEIDLTYNPTKAIRMKMTAAFPQTSQSNALPETRRYLAEWKQIWLDSAAGSGPFTLVNPVNGRISVENDIGDIERRIAAAAEGRTLDGTPDYTGSFLINYTVQSGMFKSVRLGGSVNAQGPRVIGNASADPYQLIKAPGYEQYNLNLGYWRKIGGQAWDFQLNVYNLLDDETPVYLNGTADILVAPGTANSRIVTVPNSLYYRDGLRFQFSATVTF